MLLALGTPRCTQSMHKSAASCARACTNLDSRGVSVSRPKFQRHREGHFAAEARAAGHVDLILEECARDCQKHKYSAPLKVSGHRVSAALSAPGEGDVAGLAAWRDDVHRNPGPSTKLHLAFAASCNCSAEPVLHTFRDGGSRGYLLQSAGARFLPASGLTTFTTAENLPEMSGLNSTWQGRLSLTSSVVQRPSTSL